MKKRFLLSLMLIGLLTAFKTERAAAQISAVNVYATDDSLAMSCVLPDSFALYINGYLTGTVTSTNDTVAIYINYGDGFDTTIHYVTDSSNSFYTTIYHNYVIAGTYAPYVIATASGGASGTVTAPTVTMSNTCALIQGTLYVDNNSNCIPDPGEVGLAYEPIWIVNSAAPTDTLYGGWTDDSGHYSLELLPGTYTILASPGIFYGWYWWGYGAGNITASCPASGSASVTVTGSGTLTENFAFACTMPDSFDVAAQGWNWEFVRGDSSWIEVDVNDWYWYWDYTCLSLNTTVTLTLDPHLHYLGVDPYWGIAPTSVSGSTITWNVSTASDFFYFWAYVNVYCDTTTTIGETLCNTIYATPTALTDPDLSNNTSTFCAPVLASWDPNGLAVSPQGSGPSGYIANKTDLSYDIHFQNTGSAPAANITINDTLSANLDMHTLHILKSTAPVELYVSGNAVKFRFNNINLPDSATNPKASVGSVEFAIMPKEGLAPYTPIPNRASIYFDYNPPVVTNPVLNTIIGPDGVQHVSNASMKASVYPNPAGDQVFAKTDNGSDFTMTLIDMLGRSIASNKSAYGIASVNVQTLPTGIYIVNLTNGNGKVLTTKITVQH